MKEYIDVQYSKYKYFYFDGSLISGEEVKNFFRGCAKDISIYQYNTKTINVDGYRMSLEDFKEFFENEDISINIKDYERKYTVDIKNNDMNNFVNAYAGDYIVMSDDGFPFFVIEKNLDDYEIVSEHECKKRTEKTYLYEKYSGSIDNIKSIMNGVKNCASSISVNPNGSSMIIDGYDGNTFYLDPGRYLIMDPDTERLFIV